MAALGTFQHASVLWFVISYVCRATKRRRVMLRKTLMALAATAALGVSSVAMAAHSGGHGGHSGGTSMAVHSGGSLGPGTGASNFRPSNMGLSSNVRPGHVRATGG